MAATNRVNATYLGLCLNLKTHKFVDMLHLYHQHHTHCVSVYAVC